MQVAIHSRPLQTSIFPIADFRPGMACQTANGHMVRIDKTHMGIQTPYAHVHVIRAPHISGELYLSELAPVPTKISVGDHVILHAGDAAMLIRGTVVKVEGDYGHFFLPAWNEIHQAHTAHIMSIRPRHAAR